MVSCHSEPIEGTSISNFTINLIRSMIGYANKKEPLRKKRLFFVGSIYRALVTRRTVIGTQAAGGHWQSERGTVTTVSAKQPSAVNTRTV